MYLGNNQRNECKNYSLLNLSSRKGKLHCIPIVQVLLFKEDCLNAISLGITNKNISQGENYILRDEKTSPSTIRIVMYLIIDEIGSSKLIYGSILSSFKFLFRR